MSSQEKYISNLQVSTSRPIKEIGFISRFAHGIPETQYIHDGIQILLNDVFAVAEHIIINFECEVTERLARQINRHRHISIIQQSTRYNNYYQKNLKYWLPKELMNYPEIEEYLTYTQIKRDEIQEKYHLTPEEINYLIPLCTTTNIHYTLNLRTVLHMFSIRSCDFAMQEFRDLLEELKQKLRNIGRTYGEWEFIMHFFTSCKFKFKDYTKKQEYQMLYDSYNKEYLNNKSIKYNGEEFENRLKLMNIYKELCHL